jgi:hypothetical protein
MTVYAFGYGSREAVVASLRFFVLNGINFHFVDI